MRSGMAMIKKCLFPVAGYGTRFLPATKAMPKEILPIVDKPLVQYGVEEAVEAGLTDIGFVTGRGKRAIEDHFDVSYELEHQIAGTGKEKQLEGIRALIDTCTFSYTRQIAMKGLGHAILTGRTLIGDEPFGVVLADDLCFGEGTGVLAQMTKLFRQFRCSIVAIEEVPRDETNRYGIIAGEALSDSLFRVTDMVEKPSPEQGAEQPRDHRPLHPDARHLRDSRTHRTRQERRGSDHRRVAASRRATVASSRTSSKAAGSIAEPSTATWRRRTTAIGGSSATKRRAKWCRSHDARKIARAMIELSDRLLAQSTARARSYFEQPLPLADVPTPALLLDEDALMRNVARMADFLGARGKGFRPHAKTHKCPQVAARQLAAGAVGICAAKVSEAIVLARAGVRTDSHHVAGRDTPERRTW